MILEHPHSNAFLLNRYLDSGNEAILSLIDKRARFEFIRSVREYNSISGTAHKIRFFGIDFEGRNAGQSAAYALKMIAALINPPADHPLTGYLHAAADAKGKELESILQKMKIYIFTHEQESRDLLKQYYTDILLITHAQFAFSSRRDKAMCDNFVRLYYELKKQDENPRFFGSFGTGHVNPGNKNGIAMRIFYSADTSLQKKVSVTAAQYLDCIFDSSAVKMAYNGSLNSLCGKNPVKLPDPYPESRTPNIMYVSGKELQLRNCAYPAGIISGVLVIRNFGASSFWSWE